jgi:hypothetical protein
MVLQIIVLRNEQLYAGTFGLYAAETVIRYLLKNVFRLRIADQN